MNKIKLLLSNIFFYFYKKFVERTRLNYADYRSSLSSDWTIGTIERL